MSEDNEEIIVQIDPDLEDLIPDYLKNRYKDLETIHGALNSGDFETIRITGHSMKGSGGGYGFDHITDIGKCIEDAANVQNGDDVKKQVDELTSYLARVSIVYEES
ncbi:MAG: Hpt domain-containing protein [Candidatus Anammoxibacter sp.]